MTIFNALPDVLNDDTDQDSDAERWPTNAGVIYKSSSSAHAIASHHAEIERRYGRQIPSVMMPNPSLGGNTLRIADNANRLAPDLEERLERLAVDVDFAIGVVILGGTGFLLHEYADVDDAIPRQIDVIGQSHKRQPTDPDTASPAKATINTLVSYPRLTPGTILLDHGDGYTHVGYGDTPKQFARIIGALVQDDFNNLAHDYHALFIRTIPTTGMNQDGLAQKLQQRARTENYQFTPAWWASHDDAGMSLADEGSPAVNDREQDIIAVIPERFDRIDGEDMDVRPIKAPVHESEATILGLVPLSHDWVENTLQHGSIDWLTAQIESQEGRIYNVWKAMCRDYGYSDPVETFHCFRADRVDPYLP